MPHRSEMPENAERLAYEMGIEWDLTSKLYKKESADRLTRLPRNLNELLAAYKNVYGAITRNPENNERKIMLGDTELAGICADKKLIFTEFQVRKTHTATKTAYITKKQLRADFTKTPKPNLNETLGTRFSPQQQDQLAQIVFQRAIDEIFAKLEEGR